MQFLAQNLLTTNAATGKILDIFKPTGTVTYYTKVLPISPHSIQADSLAGTFVWW